MTCLPTHILFQAQTKIVLLSLQKEDYQEVDQPSPFFLQSKPMENYLLKTQWQKVMVFILKTMKELGYQFHKTSRKPTTQMSKETFHVVRLAMMVMSLK